jgi:hypothetical protein
VHFPIDSIAGQMLGRTLGEYLVWKCLRGPRSVAPNVPAPLDSDHWRSRIFDAQENGALDFLPEHEVVKGEVVSGPPPVPEGAAPSALSWLWDQARAEWPHA